MIETIIKRDGSREPFNAEKLVGWCEWASVVGADWSGILKDAFDKVSKECKSADLQSALIKACLDKEDEPHVKMAGRLYMGTVYKECYGSVDEIPSLKTFYNDMVHLGYWEEMSYSDEELDWFDNLMDHSEDMEMTYPQAKQIVGKYSVKNRVTGQIFETPQFSYMRMALGSCKNASQEERLIDVPEFFQHYKTSVNCTTPDWTNLGTHSRGYASCCLFTAGDSIGSLNAHDTIAYKMTAASAGLGDMLLTRSAGDSIRGGLVKHNGKLPYLRLSQELARANKQGARSGALTTSICVLDPEVFDLISARNPKTVDSKRVAGIDYSLSANKSFFERVAKDQDWMLISYYYAKDLWESFFDEDNRRFNLLYEKYENDGSVPKKIVKARDIALLHIQNEQELGRQYETNITEINRHTPAKDRIYHSNLCVAPETQILTKDGYIPIAELEDEIVSIWNGEDWSETVVRKTGENQKLLKVVTNNGYEIECTPYHKFYVFNGYGRPYKEVRANDLKKDDKLAKFDLPVVEGHKEFNRAYENGFYSGDGCYYKGSQIIYLYHEKMLLKDLFSNTSWNYQEDQKRMVGYTKGLKEKFFVPSNEYNIESRLNWLAGYLDADGCVYRCGTNEQIVASSVEYNFLKEIQMMLQTLGVSSKITHMSDAGYKSLPANDGTGEMKDFYCQGSWRLLITSCDVYKLMCLGLDLKRLSVVKRLPQRDAKQFVKVSKVVDEERYDDTYCVNEPKRHMVMFNGILTGQCQEIVQPTRPYKTVEELFEYSETSGEISLCTLSAIVPDKLNLEIVDGDFTEDSIARYEKACYYALKKIDNTIDIMEYPFPNLEYTAKARRNAAVGISGLAYEMARRGLKYTSEEGKRYMHMLAELHMYSLIKASIKLSKERGVADWMDRTKWPDGWLPIDTYNRNVDKVVDATLNRDWPTLRQELIENGGHRFSFLVAHMPTESSSIASNRPNSLYGVRDLVLIKGDGEDAKIFIAPEADRLRNEYQKAWDISTKEMVNVYAIFQKFCDQGISCDFWINRTNFERATSRFSAKDMLEDWLYSKHMGLKSRYYTNTENSGDRKEEGKERIKDDDNCAGACKL